MWKLSPDAADARFAKLLAEVPHAERKDELADHSLRGYDGRIIAVAAVDHAHGVVIELTCGLDQCRDADQAAALLRRVMARADRLGQPIAAPVEEEKPKEDKPAETKPAETKPAETKPAESKPTEEPPAEDKPFQLKQPELKR